MDDAVRALNHQLGNIDLYLLDALLKGYINKEDRVLDAGCGEGRNLVWLLRQGYDCWGVDTNLLAIAYVQQLAKQLNPQKSESQRFQQSGIEQLLFPPEAFGTIICSAVLHFAESEAHFRQMFSELSRVLKPGGFLFIRTATNFGMRNNEIAPLPDTEQVLLPDSSQRFVLREGLLHEVMQKNRLSFKETPKSVLLPKQRSMGVLMLQKD